MTVVGIPAGAWSFISWTCRSLQEVDFSLHRQKQPFRLVRRNLKETNVLLRHRNLPILLKHTILVAKLALVAWTSA